MSKNKKALCDCNMKDALFPMHTCTCISIYIRFKYKDDDINFWIETPFDSELFKNDPEAAGKFIEKMEKIAGKELLNYTIDKQKNTKNTTDSIVKFNHKKT